MKIYIGADHAGYELKENLKTYLTGLGLEVIDKGAFELNNNDDYPDFITPVAEAVAKEESFGVIIGGSGQGEAMCANRVAGIRASVYYGHSLDIIKITREHNNANILSLGARFITIDEAKEAIKLFIDTKFSGDERHIRRIRKF
ncbi:MAG TPA: RpiB/LacA/LacB family sugar-phosphate isomerase [Candidatus Paceibacterota bacterium]|nr:RpiB/LacA/LacB family sugar-phosphate isomerase [Candidatus Paceibacterota bacterium]